MNVCIFGSGYVGLVAAAGFAIIGHAVRCIDIDAPRISRLRAGEIPFFEPGLKEAVSRATASGRLWFGTELDHDRCDNDVYFIAVGTPPLPDGRADVRAVHEVAQVIARQARKPAVIGIKSTVPVGTCDSVQSIIDEQSAVRHTVASVPEFLKEGSALADFLKPDRVILGVTHTEAAQVLTELYRPLQLSNEQIIVMNRRSSELAKYAANALLATRISFMNEMSRLCDVIGADIHDIRRAVGSDRRIGPHFLYAGPGYGGSCFPKDVSALATRSRDAGVVLEVAEAVSRANEAQRAYVCERALSLLEGGLQGKVVTLWGVAFKAETDDVRESPAVPLARALVEGGAEVRVHDPEAAANFVRTYGLDVRVFENEYEAAEGADLVVLMTEWRHLRTPDFGRLRASMRAPQLFDARNIWSMFDLNRSGFRYIGIGTTRQ